MDILPIFLPIWIVLLKLADFGYWNKNWCVRTSFPRSKKNLGKMSVKGKIANFYHSKSKVVNALWILAQVGVFPIGDW